MSRWFISWKLHNSPFYWLYWHLIGRAEYKRWHGHDWHAATGLYPWWSRRRRRAA